MNSLKSSITGVSDPSLFDNARSEAEAIVAEAHEQARLLTEAAEKKKKAAESDVDKIRQDGEALATNLQRSIEILSKILEELRRQIA